MSLPDTTVKHFSSAMAGAPTLPLTAGAILGVLKACLVTGFGAVTLSSLTVTAGVATATVSAGHGFTMTGAVGPVISIEGAAVEALNGEFRISEVVSATAFRFAVEGVANQSVAGTITAKRAPAGWNLLYEGENKAVFSRPALGATAELFRVANPNATSATVSGYEAMADIDTGTAQLTAGSGAWYAVDQGSLVSSWAVIADHRAVYFLSKDNVANVSSGFFGDPVSFLESDPYGCMIVCTDEYSEKFRLLSVSQYGKAIARPYSSSGTKVPVSFATGPFVDVGTFGGSASGLAYPAPGIGGLVCWDVYVYEAGALRGKMPGMLAPAHMLTVLPQWSTIDAVIDGTVRTLAVLYGRNSGGGAVVFDLTGPWR